MFHVGLRSSPFSVAGLFLIFLSQRDQNDLHPWEKTLFSFTALTSGSTIVLLKDLSRSEIGTSESKDVGTEPQRTIPDVSVTK